MKVMKNTMKCFIAVFMMAMAFVMTGTNVSAASYYSGEVTDARQVAAGNDYVTIQWSPVAGAIGYYITTYDSNYNEILIGQTTNTSYTISGLMNDISDRVYVYPVGIVDDGSQDLGYSCSVSIKTAPSAVQNFDLDLWYPHKKTSYNKSNINQISLIWTPNYNNEGYEIEVYSLKDKKLKTYDTSKTSYFDFTLNKIKNKGCKIRIRPYTKIYGNDTKIYGDWSSKKVIIPQATITSQSGESTRTIKWAKVSGAKNYTIYKTTNGGKTYKKVKTVGKNVTKYTVKGMKSGSQYGLAVAAHVKVGKKTQKSLVRYHVTLTYY